MYLCTVNWRINQTIVAVCTRKFFTEGDTFKIQGIIKNWCKCGGYRIDIGSREYHVNFLCLTCGTQVVENNDVIYHHESCFKAVEEKGDVPIETFLKSINNGNYISIGTNYLT